MKRRAMDERLRRAFGRPQRDAAPDRGDRVAGQAGADRGIRAFLQRRRRERAAGSLPDDGEVLENAAGRCLVVRGRYGPDHRHGDRVLAQTVDASWVRLAERARDDAFSKVQLEQCLFLDTETTGLSGGVGTTVFMTGLGFFEPDGSFVLEQAFLRSFADEPAKLRHVADRLEEHPVLVTYVGKTFDRHRLATRMTLHGVDAPILELSHLDLYYLARRAWRDELPNVRLQTVERHKLGLTRDDDLPGSEAPQAFLDWLRDGTGPIDRVFEHNRLDVLTLVTLLGVLGSHDSD